MRSRWRGLDLAVVGGPALIAGVLCAYQLGDRSLWLDEGATVAIVSQHGAALWHAISHDGGNMLAFYVLLHLVHSLFGDGLVALRLPSLLADAVSAATVAVIALRLFGDRRVAFTAGCVTAVSLPLVFWGQDARGYALMTTFSTLAWLALVVYGQGGSRRALAGYAAATVLSLYTGFDAVLLVPAQLLLLLFLPAWRPRLRAVIVALGAVAIASVPLLVLALRRGSSQLFWVPGLSREVLNQASQTLTSAGMPPNFHATVTTTLLEGTTWFLLALAATEVPRWLRTRGAILVPASWLAVSTLLALLAAVLGEPVELSRAAVLVMPALALLLAWVLHDPRFPWLVGWAAAAAILALRLAQLTPSYGTSPENWKAAAAYVAEHGPGCVVFYPQDGRMPFDYYLRQDTRSSALQPVLPATPWHSVRPFVEEYSAGGTGFPARTTAECARLFLISSHDGQPSGPPASRADFGRFIELRAAFRRLYPGYHVRLFGYAAVVRVTTFMR